MTAATARSSPSSRARSSHSSYEYRLFPLSTAVLLHQAPHLFHHPKPRRPRKKASYKPSPLSVDMTNRPESPRESLDGSQAMDETAVIQPPQRTGLPPPIATPVAPLSATGSAATEVSSDASCTISRRESSLDTSAGTQDMELTQALHGEVVRRRRSVGSNTSSGAHNAVGAMPVASGSGQSSTTPAPDAGDASPASPDEYCDSTITGDPIVLLSSSSITDSDDSNWIYDPPGSLGPTPEMLSPNDSRWTALSSLRSDDTQVYGPYLAPQYGAAGPSTGSAAVHPDTHASDGDAGSDLTYGPPLAQASNDVLSGPSTGPNDEARPTSRQSAPLLHSHASDGNPLGQPNDVEGVLPGRSGQPSAEPTQEENVALSNERQLEAAQLDRLAEDRPSVEGPIDAIDPPLSDRSRENVENLIQAQKDLRVTQRKPRSHRTQSRSARRRDDSFTPTGSDNGEVQLAPDAKEETEADANPDMGSTPGRSDSAPRPAGRATRSAPASLSKAAADLQAQGENADPANVNHEGRPSRSAHREYGRPSRGGADLVPLAVDSDGRPQLPAESRRGSRTPSQTSSTGSRAHASGEAGQWLPQYPASPDFLSGLDRAQLEEKHAKALAAQKKEYEARLEQQEKKLEARLDQQHVEYEARLAKLDAEAKAALAEQKKELKEALAEQETKFAARLDKQKEEAKEALVEQEAKFDVRLETQKQESKGALVEQEAKFDARFETQKEDAKETLDKQKKESKEGLKERLDEQKQLLREGFDGQMRALEAQITRLTDSLTKIAHGQGGDAP